MCVYQPYLPFSFYACHTIIICHLLNYDLIFRLYLHQWTHQQKEDKEDLNVIKRIFSYISLLNTAPTMKYPCAFHYYCHWRTCRSWLSLTSGHLDTQTQKHGAWFSGELGTSVITRAEADQQMFSYKWSLGTKKVICPIHTRQEMARFSCGQFASGCPIHCKALKNLSIWCGELNMGTSPNT